MPPSICNKNRLMGSGNLLSALLSYKYFIIEKLFIQIYRYDEI